jgi:hypothetical protein
MSLKMLIEEYECLSCKKASIKIQGNIVYTHDFIEWFYRHYEKMKNNYKGV